MVTIAYEIESVAGGYMAYCTSNRTATAFGRTKEEAVGNLAEAIHDYLELFPEKAGMFSAVATISIP